MFPTTVADYATLRAARALTGNSATGKHLAALIPTDQQAAFTTDPTGWIAKAPVTVPVRCATAAEGEAVDDPTVKHHLILDGNLVRLPNHPQITDLAAETFLIGLGASAPTCLLIAAAVTGSGDVPVDHAHRFTGSTRTPLLLARYLHAARAWLAHDPDIDLSALFEVLRRGYGPTDWDPWVVAGFTPETAKPWLRRALPVSIAQAWTDAGLNSTRAAALAAAGHAPTVVTDLTAAGLGRSLAYQWANAADTLTAAQITALHQRGFTPTTGTDAVTKIGYDLALAYGDRGLVEGRPDSRLDLTWWDAVGDHPDGPAAADHWRALGLAPLTADFLINARWDLYGDEDNLRPDLIAEWVQAGVRTVAELHALADLTYCPHELDGAPRPVAPNGVPLPWGHTIWLSRLVAVADLPTWVAALDGAADLPAWDGPCCLIPDCQVRGCTEPITVGHGTRPDGLPDIGDELPDGHPNTNPAYLSLLDALCDAASEGFPTIALPALTALGPATVRTFEYATEIAAEVTTDEDLIAFLTSGYADPGAHYPKARDQVARWRDDTALAA